jgi:cyclophilin family peptidyl-prolyl cis-trans isomerase
MSPMVVLLAAALFTADSPAGGGKNDKPANPRVALETSLGRIVLELEAAKAPKSVENFLEYVKAGLYDGTIFHRVIPGFMIQGGGFDTGMEQRHTRAPIQNEAANGLRNARGTVAMARTGDPNSATSQFFINTVDNRFLDFKDATPRGIGYAVFGRVVEGMDVVDKIEKVRTATQGPFENVPVEPVVIKKATLLP